MTVALDLGSGPTPRNPFGADQIWGIDINGTPDGPVLRADLVLEPIPFEENTVDFVTAYDFIEHVPRLIYVPALPGFGGIGGGIQRRYPFVELMNEIWRVLRPGGTFLSSTPAYPAAPAFRDPSHVNIISTETFPLYFDDVHRMATTYGFRGAFHVVSQHWSHNTWLVSRMTKVELTKPTCDQV